MHSVVRYPYQNGDLKPRGPAEHIADLPGSEYHWTRDIQFSLDGKRMFVSVGAASNVDDPDTTPAEKNTADILQFNPDGSGMRIYASGIRNPVGLAVDPKTGELWCSTNERDGLGDNLVPDYITSIKDGGFYGWPYSYIGSNYDPEHKGKRPDLVQRAIVRLSHQRIDRAHLLIPRQPQHIVQQRIRHSRHAQRGGFRSIRACAGGFRHSSPLFPMPG